MVSMIVVQCAVTWYLVGLIWLIQCVQYPLFMRIGADSFREAHAFHMRAITPVVGLPMVVELGLTLWWVWSTPSAISWLALGLVSIVWLSTVAISVPCHRRLELHGKQEAVIRVLVHTNWLRTLAWTAHGLLLAMALDGGSIIF